MSHDDKILDEIDRLKDALTVDDVSYSIGDCPDSLTTGILAAYRENDALEAGRLLLNYLEAGLEKAAADNIAAQDEKDREDYEAEQGMAARDERLVA